MAAPSPVTFFPFPPNWKSVLEETITFGSWVIPAEDYDEQTGSNWGNAPRRTLEYSILLTQERAQRLDNLLSSWQGKFFEIAHWGEQSKLTAPASVGAAVLALPTAGRSFVVGNRIVIWNSPEHYELHTIDALDADSIDLDGVTTYAWSSGTRVFPLLYGAISISSSGQRVTDNKIQMGVQFECEPNSTPGNTEDDGLALAYQGEELYLERVNWVAGMSFSFDSQREMLDRNTMKFDMHSASYFSPQTRAHNWTMKSLAEIATLRSWLGRREGQAIPVYMPTGTADFTLLAPPTSGLAYIRVMPNSYGNLLPGHRGRRDIIILLRDGTYVIKRITSVTLTSATEHRLNFTGALGATIPLASIKRVSFLHLYRQESRAATIQWLTNEVATCQLDMVSKLTPE